MVRVGVFAGLGLVFLGWAFYRMSVTAWLFYMGIVCLVLAISHYLYPS